MFRNKPFEKKRVLMTRSYVDVITVLKAIPGRIFEVVSNQSMSSCLLVGGNSVEIVIKKNANLS